jgi:DNA topoisomerase VI subunit B
MSIAELSSPRRRTAPLLERVAFKTSRLIEFCSKRELTAQTGHTVEDWPLVIEKEVVDNTLDACEEAQVPPEVEVEVSTRTGEISIADNGPGIPEEVVRDILDYDIVLVPGKPTQV